MLCGWMNFKSSRMDDVEKTCIHYSPLSSGGPMWRSRPVGHTRSSSIMDISSSCCIWMMFIHVSRPFECSPRIHPSPSSTRIGHSLEWTLMSPDIHPVMNLKTGLDGWVSSIVVPAATWSSIQVFPTYDKHIGHWKLGRDCPTSFRIHIFIQRAPTSSRIQTRKCILCTGEVAQIDEIYRMSFSFLWFIVHPLLA